MRMIDADSLSANMDKGIQGTAREYLKFYQMAVNEEPAAYDVDKVIEQISAATGIDGLVFYVDGRPVIYKEQAIEIIRQGGQQDG